MYLSRLILNPHNRRVQREVAEPYQMHRSLMRAFPDGLEAEDERVLFRVESNPRTGGLVVLVQSQLKPDWGWLAGPGADGYLLRGVEANPAVKEFEPSPAAGQVLAFRLRANPTAKRTFEEEQGKKKKRLGLCREEDQLKWLARKGEQGGFRLVSARAGQQGTVGGHLTRDGKRHDLELLSVQFDGLLEVTDADRLRETVARGIGSGKGLGFGLLSLARPRG